MRTGYQRAYSNIQRLIVDNKYDGDTASQVGLYTEETIRECKLKDNQAVTYLNPKGGFLNSPRTDTVERVIIGMMRR